MFSILLFIIAPLLGLPLYIFLYVNCRNKKKSIVYSMLIGISLGIISYYFIPKSGYDLVRHQDVVYRLTNVDIKSFFEFTQNYDLEFLPLLYSYLISFIGNVDLLQFFIVSAGYTIILYMLNDYKIKKDLNIIYFICISLFIVISFQHLFFISGLYFYIATILFALILYMDYIKQKNPKLCIALYIIILFVHNAMFLPFALVMIYKALKNEFNIKTVLIIILVFLGSFLIINYLDQIINNNITDSLVRMYGNYTNNEDHFKIIYSGSLFILEIIKMCIVVLAIILSNKNKKLNGFILGMTIMIILMMTRSTVTIRYIMLIQLVGIIPLVDLFKNSKKEIKTIMIIVLFVTIIMYIMYYYGIFSDQSFGNLSDNYFNNIISIFNKE